MSLCKGCVNPVLYFQEARAEWAGKRKQLCDISVRFTAILATLKRCCCTEGFLQFVSKRKQEVLKFQIFTAATSTDYFTGRS